MQYKHIYFDYSVIGILSMIMTPVNNIILRTLRIISAHLKFIRKYCEL